MLMPVFLNLHCFEKYRANGYVQIEDDAVKEDVAKVINEFQEIIKTLKSGIL